MLLYCYNTLTLFTINSVGEQFLRSITEERHATHDELVQDDAHRPPVHGLAVALEAIIQYYTYIATLFVLPYPLKMKNHFIIY